MIKNKPIWLNITSRNIAFVYDFGISEIGVFEFNSIEAFENGLAYSYESVCEMCLDDYLCHMWKFDRDISNKEEQVKYCEKCRHKIASLKMTETKRTLEGRLKSSKASKLAHENNPEAFDNARIKRKNGWCKSEQAKEIAKRNLKYFEGEFHPNWNPNKTEFKLYYNRVIKEQSKWDVSLIANYDESKRGLCGVDDAYQIDHIVSIKHAFGIGADPYYIGHICNLQFIPWEDNRAKWDNTPISYEELKQVVNKFDACVSINI